MLRELLNLIYPLRCPLCGSFIDTKMKFCEKCAEEVTIFRGSFEIPDSSGNVAAFEYNEFISSAVFLLKDRIIGNAAYALGTSLAERVAEENFDVDMVIPTPMYSKDIRKRGFNQSAVIGKIVAKSLEIPFCEPVSKIRPTLPQKTLNAEERRLNLIDSFAVPNPETIRNKKILLVDDICTTGNTMAAVVSVLLDNGADKVYCAACCKTPVKNS